MGEIHLLESLGCTAVVHRFRRSRSSVCIFALFPLDIFPRTSIIALAKFKEYQHYGHLSTIPGWL